MLGLNKFLAGMILVLSFLAGQQVALRAQCWWCYQDPGPAGFPENFVMHGQCPCSPDLICWYFDCNCMGMQLYHAQCGENFYCIGC